MFKKDISFPVQRAAVLLLLLLSISCSTDNIVENGRFLGLNIGASKEQVFAILRGDFEVYDISAKDWWDVPSGYEYRLGKYPGTYEQFVDVVANHSRIIIKGLPSPTSPDSSPGYSPSELYVVVHFEDSVVGEVDATGYFNATDDKPRETLGITPGMSRDDVRDILIKNHARIREMYSMSTEKREWIEMNDFSAQDYEAMLSFDVWYFLYEDKKGVWDEDFYLVDLIFVDNLLYEIQYDWYVINID